MFLIAHRHLSAQKDARPFTHAKRLDREIGTQQENDHKGGATFRGQRENASPDFNTARLLKLHIKEKQTSHSSCLTTVTSHCSSTGPHNKHGCCVCKPARLSPFTFKPVAGRKCARCESTFIHVSVVSDAVAWQHP